ncbi:hypothetical protein RFI_28289 [Reticulomyxa filosa]|uniref:EF-hand domain-containing protein n=1 Tax=Reticulomyxa filosa TaxID=46433 RepID=X6M541_RETFI|nr:hypothetical protein RFI_28289 [Reticulomyxa filosa]|eukprot:ETO09103.1 hypothetical protein RFI_28289 [Reticulomyxa filosa]
MKNMITIGMEELYSKQLINAEKLIGSEAFLGWYKENFITLPIESHLDKSAADNWTGGKVTILMSSPREKELPGLSKQPSRIRVLVDSDVKDPTKEAEKDKSNQTEKPSTGTPLPLQSNTVKDYRPVSAPSSPLPGNDNAVCLFKRLSNRVKRKSMMMERKQIDIILDSFANGHGYIDNKDLDKIWEQLKDSIGNRTIAECIQELDKANTAKSKSNNYRNGVESRLKQILQTITDEDIRVAFNKVDIENSGKIHFTAFCYALEDLNIRWGIDEAKAIFTKLDEHKTKYIDFQEFKQGLFEVNGDQMESFWLRLLGKENTQEAIHGKEDLRTDAFENEDENKEPMTLEEILPIIDNKKSDWKERLRALRDLALHFTKDAGSHLHKTPSEFQQEMERFKEPLALQILEMRSAVCRAACQYTAEIIIFRKQQMLPFVPFLLHKLFEARRNSIKVIAESAYNCGQVMIQNVSDNDQHILLDTLIAEFDTKFAVVRETILEYVEIIVQQTTDNKKDDPYFDKIESLLTKAIADADGKVRTQAFQTLASLSFVDEPRSRK